MSIKQNSKYHFNTNVVECDYDGIKLYEINEDNYYEVERLMNFVNKKLIKKQGIYILDAFNEDTTNKILQIIRLYPNLDAFLINYNLEDRIVVRFCPFNKDDINIINFTLNLSLIFSILIL